MADVIRCDACGCDIDRDAARYRLIAVEPRTEQADPWSLGRGPSFDLCSSRCLQTYATANSTPLMHGFAP